MVSDTQRRGHLPDRTAELVDSILERRVRMTLRHVSVVLSGFGLGSGALGLFMIAIGRIEGVALPFIICAGGGIWCRLIVAALDRDPQGRTYRWMLLPICVVPSIMLISAYLMIPHGVASLFNGPITLGYFLSIIFSASLFDRRLTLAVTVASIATYLAIYWGCARTDLLRLISPIALQDPIFAQDMTDGSLYAVRAFVMLAAGWMLAQLIRVAYDVMTEVASVITQFGLVIDPRVRDLMLSGEVDTNGEELDLTVMFADIRGFTTFAERWEPPRLLGLMKDYFDLMGPPIRDEDGTIIEYIGDEIMTVFGAPVVQPDNAVRAGRAALEMQRVLAEQRVKWELQGYPRIEIGIGLNAGPMLVGRIGSSERQKYGALGDNVNLGSRLQGLTRDYNVKILASDAWAERTGGAFVLRELDHVVVKGRQSGVTIYEVVGLAGEPLPPEQAQALEAWTAALEAWRAKDLEGSRRHAQECLRLCPGDGPAHRLLGLLPRA